MYKLLYKKVLFILVCFSIFLLFGVNVDIKMFFDWYGKKIEGLL